MHWSTKQEKRNFDHTFSHMLNIYHEKLRSLHNSINVVGKIYPRIKICQRFFYRISHVLLWLVIDFKEKQTPLNCLLCLQIDLTKWFLWYLAYRGMMCLAIYSMQSRWWKWLPKGKSTCRRRMQIHVLAIWKWAHFSPNPYNIIIKPKIVIIFQSCIIFLA